MREVSETDAVMIWPTAYAWVDPETLTSLIEAHGVTPREVLRPSYEGTAGWPVLVPVQVVVTTTDRPSDRTVEEALAAIEAPVRLLDLGDPGTAHDRSTPRSELAPYLGPVQPDKRPDPRVGQPGRPGARSRLGASPAVGDAPGPVRLAIEVVEPGEATRLDGAVAGPGRRELDGEHGLGGIRVRRAAGKHPI